MVIQADAASSLSSPSLPGPAYRPLAWLRLAPVSLLPLRLALSSNPESLSLYPLLPGLLNGGQHAVELHPWLPMASSELLSAPPGLRRASAAPGGLSQPQDSPLRLTGASSGGEHPFPRNQSPARPKRPRRMAPGATERWQAIREWPEHPPARSRALSARLRGICAYPQSSAYALPWRKCPVSIMAVRPCPTTDPRMPHDKIAQRVATESLTDFGPSTCHAHTMPRRRRKTLPSQPERSMPGRTPSHGPRRPPHPAPRTWPAALRLPPWPPRLPRPAPSPRALARPPGLDARGWAVGVGENSPLRMRPLQNPKRLPSDFF